MNKLFAWGAQNLIASLSSNYYLHSLRAAREGFIVQSWMAPNQYGFELHTLMLGFGLPVAFALALPGASHRGYWVRLLTTVLASYLISVFVVGLVADRTLITNFAKFGLQLQPGWRVNFSQAVITQLWTFTTVGFPIFVVMILAPATGQLSPDLKKYFGSSSGSHPTGAMCVLCAIVVLGIALDPKVRSDHQATKETDTRRYFDDIEELNRDGFGAGLLSLGKSIAARGDVQAAVNTYKVAVRHLEGDVRVEAKKEFERLVGEQRKAKRIRRLKASERRRRRSTDPAQ